MNESKKNVQKRTKKRTNEKQKKIIFLILSPIIFGLAFQCSFANLCSIQNRPPHLQSKPIICILRVQIWQRFLLLLLLLLISASFLRLIFFCKLSLLQLPILPSVNFFFLSIKHHLKIFLIKSKISLRLNSNLERIPHS
ncbi:hypothetical protein DERP_014075 [Dermatophagoides pteronyssinus]|uniref:Transmembrane protein n=1 Tax=Dermatophagoides pteronyssinus TaxID=6956 RepID=A0ABQ8J6E4_DERPT|nr:hypothetical protein DERP_014075 [Dermatophagoides pteronyssinus]